MPRPCCGRLLAIPGSSASPPHMASLVEAYRSHRGSCQPSRAISILSHRMFVRNSRVHERLTGIRAQQPRCCARKGRSNEQVQIRDPQPALFANPAGLSPYFSAFPCSGELGCLHFPLSNDASPWMSPCRPREFPGRLCMEGAPSPIPNQRRSLQLHCGIHDASSGRRCPPSARRSGAAASIWMTRISGSDYAAYSKAAIVG
jgi:hypothetical protein